MVEKDRDGKERDVQKEEEEEEEEEMTIVREEGREEGREKKNDLFLEWKGVREGDRERERRK